ncbi:hypothetical protein AKO1_002746, partial [Acrasis kona]
MKATFFFLLFALHLVHSEIVVIAGGDTLYRNISIAPNIKVDWIISNFSNIDKFYIKLNEKPTESSFDWNFSSGSRMNLYPTNTTRQVFFMMSTKQSAPTQSYNITTVFTSQQVLALDVDKPHSLEITQDTIVLIKVPQGSPSSFYLTTRTFKGPVYLPPDLIMIGKGDTYDSDVNIKTTDPTYSNVNVGDLSGGEWYFGILKKYDSPSTIDMMVSTKPPLLPYQGQIALPQPNKDKYTLLVPIKSYSENKLTVYQDYISDFKGANVYFQDEAEPVEWKQKLITASLNLPISAIDTNITIHVSSL